METEIRAKIINPEKFEHKLLDLGAKFIKTREQLDVYFSEIYLCEKLGYSFLIRIRNDGGKISLTYKGAQLKRDGVWEEYEFEIKDQHSGVEMLKAMGLEEVIQVRKKRREYKLNDFSICLDDIDGLGEFVEIELIGGGTLREKLYELMIALGIDREQIICKGYVTMLLAKNNSPYAKYIVN